MIECVHNYICKETGVQLDKKTLVRTQKTAILGTAHILRKVLT